MPSKKRRDAPLGAEGGRAKNKKTVKSAPSHTLVAVAAPPKSKHHTYFEFVENTDKKKKKLEFKIVSDTSPPPGFEFVSIGNPDLTTKCKDLSRAQDAMIFIVSDSKRTDEDSVAHQVHRVGHHIRQTIVEQARASLSHLPERAVRTHDGAPEPIPRDQQEYNTQVDDAIRDLFPRIPNTDRQLIIEHSFQLEWSGKGEPPVGLSGDITLARRVQLATLAHIRHSHTRYDELLRETTWNNARKVVEKACLDFIVKWRGDDETGRDQLDEILREVVVISDSEEDEVEEIGKDDEVLVARSSTRLAHGPLEPAYVNRPRRHYSQRQLPGEGSQDFSQVQVRTQEKKNQRGFKRYRAFQDALRRHEEASYRGTLPGVVPNPGQPSRLENVGATQGMLLSSQQRSGSQEAYRLLPGLRYEAVPPSVLPHNPASSQGNTIYDIRDAPASADTGRYACDSGPQRIQDWLVPSIEPTGSPEQMRTASVRTAHPRDGEPWAAYRVLPMQDGITEPSSHRLHSTVLPRERPLPSSYARPGGRMQDPSDARQRVTYPREVQAPLEPMSRLALGATGSTHVTKGRILVGAGTGSHRLQPSVLMEDRGGFYERVTSYPDDPRGQDLQRTHYDRVAHEDYLARRVPSTAESSRAFMDSRGRHEEYEPVLGEPSSYSRPTLNRVSSRIPIEGNCGRRSPVLSGSSHTQDRLHQGYRTALTTADNPPPIFWEIHRDENGSAFQPHSTTTTHRARHLVVPPDLDDPLPRPSRIYPPSEPIVID